MSQIVAIRLTSNTVAHAEHISQIKLSDGTIETREQAVSYIDRNFEYYYTSVGGYRAIVESVHPIGRPAYIRTKGDSTLKDNLLNLPRF